ncbi:MAG: helicase [Pirellulaceae bacterium]|nr:MAG: helicase [Pirellulaceae bacterium]
MDTARVSRPQHLSSKATLRSRLARLDLRTVEKLLGPRAGELLKKGALLLTNLVPDRDVYLRGDVFRVTLEDEAVPGGRAMVTITLSGNRSRKLLFRCNRCQTVCRHVGATFSLILEDKYSLGLSDVPKPDVPLELLSESELVERALAERRKRSREEGYRLQSTDPSTPWTDYVLTNTRSGKTYRLALRGLGPGKWYCSCPDFRTNRLGTCKHLMYAERRVRERFSASQLQVPPTLDACEVYLQYTDTVTLHLAVPDDVSAEASRLVAGMTRGPIHDIRQLLSTVRKLEQQGYTVRIFPDAEEWIEQYLYRERVARLVEEIRKDPAGHPLRTTLLRIELLPYQMDGIAFAVGVGRAVLADDMGLGKTIQAIGVAMLLRRLAGIRRVLVVCPASVKSQWRNEILRSCDATVEVVQGGAADRVEQYLSDKFFTVCNYEQVLRDLSTIESVRWDLIILDEGQRIKNWEAKTSRCIKALRSPFALVLSGTPLENRLDELYSVVQFVDDQRLPPAYRFFHRHRVVDERGRVLGYKNLDELRQKLRPILLRRTREEVLLELPERMVHTVRIAPTGEQKVMSDELSAKAAMIAAKPFLTEMDLLRLQKLLLQARMCADSTFLVDKRPPGYSSKIQHLEEMLPTLFSNPHRKAVLFSEWTTMLDLIEPILKRLKLDFVRLDGRVPQRRRQQLVNRFQTDPNCRLFLTTNAGSTGLNLQAANTVINVDLPWNPAVLEQRIGRAHRLGQRKPVDVYLLVTEQTLEERLLNVLAQKKTLALAVLDPDSDLSEVDCDSGAEELKRRLERLLGPKPLVPIDESSMQRVCEELDRLSVKATEQPCEPHQGAALERSAYQQRVAAAGGQLLGAVFGFLKELVAPQQHQTPPELVAVVRRGLEQCVTADADGRPQLTLTLPEAESLDQLAQTLAALLVPGNPGPADNYGCAQRR